MDTITKKKKIFSKLEVLMLALMVLSAVSMNPLFIISIFTAACIYTFRKRDKSAIRFFIISSLILVSLPPLIFINVVKMSIKSREMRSRQVCLEYQLRDVYNVVKRYTESNDGYLPQAELWCDVLMEFDSSLTEESFRHPQKNGHVIAYNENVAGMRLGMLRSDTVLFFEAKGNLNLVGSQELIDELETEFAYIILADGMLKEYWVREKGIRRYDYKFTSARWKGPDE